MYNVKYKVYADRESEGGDSTIQCSSRPNLAQCNNSCSTRRGDAVELVSPNFWDQWHPTMLKLDWAKAAEYSRARERYRYVCRYVCVCVSTSYYYHMDQNKRKSLPLHLSGVQLCTVVPMTFDWLIDSPFQLYKIKPILVVPTNVNVLTTSPPPPTINRWMLRVRRVSQHPFRYFFMS